MLILAVNFYTPGETDTSVIRDTRQMRGYAYRARSRSRSSLIGPPEIERATTDPTGHRMTGAIESQSRNR